MHKTLEYVEGELEGGGMDNCPTWRNSFLSGKVPILRAMGGQYLCR